MKRANGIGLVYLLTLLIFVILDWTWLLLVAAPMFQSHLGAILRPEPLVGPVIAFYPIYCFGLVVLAVRPAITAQSIRQSAILGAVVGLTSYATFDLTNLAVIKGWTIKLAAVDMAWGVFASALAAMAGTLVGLRSQSAKPAHDEVRARP